MLVCLFGGRCFSLNDGDKLFFNLSQDGVLSIDREPAVDPGLALLEWTARQKEMPTSSEVGMGSKEG